jgi:hypothetical protein
MGIAEFHRKLLDSGSLGSYPKQPGKASGILRAYRQLKRDQAEERQRQEQALELSRAAKRQRDWEYRQRISPQVGKLTDEDLQRALMLQAVRNIFPDI